MSNGRDSKGRFLRGNKISKGHAFRPRWGNSFAETHGLKTAQKWLTQWGSHAIDRRSTVGKNLAQWKNRLIEDLGGKDVISVQQEEIADICMREKLLLDSVDRWLFEQQTLIRPKKKSVVPVLLERQKIADSLAKHLSMLGLNKRKVVKTLEETLAEITEEQEREAQEEVGRNE